MPRFSVQDSSLVSGMLKILAINRLQVSSAGLWVYGWRRWIGWDQRKTTMMVRFGI